MAIILKSFTLVLTSALPCSHLIQFESQSVRKENFIVIWLEKVYIKNYCIREFE